MAGAGRRAEAARGPRMRPGGGSRSVGMWRLARAGARAPPALTALAAAGAGPGGHGGTEGWYEWAARSAPVHWAESGLAALQEATGLPWWAAIAGGAAVLRTAVTLPLAAQQGRLLAKLENLQPEIKELAQRLRYEVSARGKQLGWSEKVARLHFARNMRRIVTELYIRDNCHPFKATLLLWVQVPMWVCVSLALRNCSVGARGSADLCFPDKNASFTDPEASYELLPHGVGGDDPYCCHSALFHGAVLAVLEPRGTVPQPPAALSRLPPAVPHSKDHI
ncbi:cytochrome c oxidase assembly protein COX18, mitochondrial isoform X2 [Taeniopygia guttata]|uniref:cytochrome c oxidase assembly protein COX18, mitochondrial isoform X2 n=1 Tax=Taeniopygia guttata TaxID=59729 RepID=UPI003BB86972